MTVTKPTQEEVRELYFLFAPDKLAQPRLPLVPELVLDGRDLKNLVRVLRESGSSQITHTQLEREVLKPARHFPQDLYLQERPSPSASDARFRWIQNEALSLLDALGVRAARPSELPEEINARLQMAASEYGIQVGKPQAAIEAIHWDFWQACKLPSVVVGIALLEHWAGMARKQLRAELRKGRRHAGNTAFRVLVHRLALAWLHATGNVPGAGYSPSRGGESPFTRFVMQYLAAMRSAVTPDHRRHVGNIDRELRRTHDSIRSQLRVLKRRLRPRKRTISA